MSLLLRRALHARLPHPHRHSPLHQKIASHNLRGSAETIYASNLLGATCARVCPVQELCEGACVLGADHKPIAIGRLQRFAMDHARSTAITRP